MNEPQSSHGRSSTLFVLAAIVIVLAGLKAAQTLLVPVLLAVFIAIIASTPIGWLTRRRVPNWLAVSMVLVVLILVVTGLGMVIVQTVNEFTNQEADYRSELAKRANQVYEGLQSIGLPVSEETWKEVISPGSALEFTTNTLNAVGNLIQRSFLVFLIVIFILAEATEWPKKLKTFLSDRELEIEWLNQFSTTLNRYIAIKTTTSLLTGTLVTIFLTVLGVDFAILWGLLAFLLNYIPNIGSFIAAIPAVLVTLVQFEFEIARALIVVIGYVVINVGIGAGIEPRFLGRTLGLSTLVVFLSLIFWGWMFGPVGMLLSVPLTMTAKIAFGTSKSTEWIAHLLEPGVPRNNQIKADKSVSSPDDTD
ncbi:MAG: AI-2E family transporter [Gammaproteobacteria bacterium]|nr:AI-2E family transporter [Gammaproteobacteria bacterium]